MRLRIPPELMFATRLVRAGRLRDATATIQRALRGYVPHRARAAPHKAAEVDETARPQRGRFVTASYSNHAGTRRYKTYVPAIYDGKPLPLVVMLHGCKQNPDDFAAGTRMNVLAEEYGILVVYPEQARRANVSQCWNWFQTRDQQRDQGEPSLIAGITREAAEAYRVDSSRIYVAGLSAGGAMAAVMGATYADLYAAVGIHSGLAYAAAQDVPSAFAAMRGDGSKNARPPASAAPTIRTVPTIVFHGDADQTVHPSNGEDVIAGASRPFDATNPPTPPRSEDCEVENGSAGGRDYTRSSYRDSSGNAVLEHWIVHGAGHAWSGGSASGSFADPRGPEASREMLRFFLQHRTD